ncbi:hypothetical protein [Mycolicibacterium chlorophenolicum]|uniref:Transcriptional repressor NrdR n=1 Tax=Mycolicibacterium chlorophenolicum TaxID=37916 RepID=A0A0J6VLK9_9MYCO|nr:hypothetical protein [Mycolicibacterium chlorophenolicum]KMO71114.1 Transcriptional repressor NrdR [Mycolicibacterium chlorophenolicum]
MAVEYLCPVPGCGTRTEVTRTTSFPEHVVRERTCKSPARHRHSTSERRSNPLLLVQRSANAGGVIEAWDRSKVWQSIALAGDLTKFPQIVDAYVDDVITALIAGHEPDEPIPTKDIGLEIIRQFRSGKSATAAARYSAKFFPSRPEGELRIGSVSELLDLFRQGFGWDGFRGADATALPTWVKKKPTDNQSKDWVDDFHVSKLWDSLAIATKGMSSAAKWWPTVGPEGVNEEEWFIAALVADVLDAVHGQTTVTSGQISAACIATLTEVHPLGALRYSLKAKSLKTKPAILAEVAEVARREMSIDLEAVHRKWNQREVSELAAVIDQRRKDRTLS